jgi:hypothetical protein
MESLKSTFRATRTETTEECPKVDLTIAYALGDPDLDEKSEIKEHIRTCRYCLDMFLDVRAAKSESQSLEGKKVDILPGLQGALEPDTPPSSIWAKIRNIFSGGTLLSPKPIAVFATACLVLFVLIYGLLDRNIPVKIEIMLHGRSITEVRGGKSMYKEIQLEPGGTLKSGDSFRVQAKIDKDAFIYVIFYDSLGKISFIEKGYINAGKDVFMPDINNWYQLDKNAGTETIYLLASRNEIKKFDSKIEDLKKTGVDTISQLFPKASIQSFSFKHE